MFSIYDPSTYSETPEGYAVFDTDVYFYISKKKHFITVKEIVEYIQNNLIPKYKNSFVLKKHIQTYMEWLYDMFATESQEQKEKRKLRNELNRNELIKAQLNNLQNITRKNQFNPRDERTYKYAKNNVITVIDGIPIYNSMWENNKEKRTYLFETEFVVYIYEMYEYEKNTSLHDYINKQADYYVRNCTDYTPKKSDLTIKGYTFTIAQKEMMKYLTDEDKILLTDVILTHFANKNKRYELAQNIFYTKFSGRIDNMLFAELCFCNDIEKEQGIMYDYYSCFDRIESKKQLEEIINNEYLNLYPELKEEVKKELLYLNF